MNLSVLITYHNEGPLLTDCLRSLWRQTIRPNEILIFDDASEIRPEPYIPNIPADVFRNPVSEGPARARNFLLAHARNEYVHFHDADDLFAPHWSEAIATALSKAPRSSTPRPSALADKSGAVPDVVFTEVSARGLGLDPNKLVIGFEHLSGKHRANLLDFAIKQVILTPSGVYRTDVVRELGGFRSGLMQCEDYDFHIRLAARGIHYSVLLDPLVIIRIRSNSHSQNRSQVFSEKIKAIRLLSFDLPPAYAGALADACAEAASNLFHLGLKEEAREAFQIAKKIGPPLFRDQRRLYRLLAKMGGQELAEKIGWIYRSTVPPLIRTALGKRS